MQPTRTANGVRLGGNARQRFHESRGIGRLLDSGDVLLDPVETAFLLYRGDLPDIDGLGFSAYVGSIEAEHLLIRFLVYRDFRERGFYLSPWTNDGTVDFVVFSRGSDPVDGEVAYEVRVVDERHPIPVTELEPGVLAVVDEEGEIGYIAVDRTSWEGTAPVPTAQHVPAALAGTRVITTQATPELYGESFFGQPVGGRDALEAPLQLSLIEAVYLAEHDVIELEADLDSLYARGRDLESDRFDRRLAVYRALRGAGVVPKTGYKFGADFRVYRAFTSTEEMTHSEELVRILEPDDVLLPHELALDIRLAHGVGKRMVFALPSGSDDTAITWISIARLTP